MNMEIRGDPGQHKADRVEFTSQERAVVINIISLGYFSFVCKANDFDNESEDLNCLFIRIFHIILTEVFQEGLYLMA